VSKTIGYGKISSMFMEIIPIVSFIKMSLTLKIVFMYMKFELYYNSKYLINKKIIY
jgi:hypothetical protein